MKKVLLYMAVAFLLVCFAVSPPPTPHSIAGTIYRSDAVNQVPLGTMYRINDTVSGFVVVSATNIPVPLMSGAYFETVEGNNNDVIVLTAWNSTNYGRRIFALSGDMENMDVNLNSDRPPEVAVQVQYPENNSVHLINESFNVTAIITAIGGSSSVGCNATIFFSNHFTVNLSQDSSNHLLGDIALGSSVITHWHLLGIGGWKVNITVTAKCSSDQENFEGRNRDGVYNILLKDSSGPIIHLRSPADKSWSRISKNYFVFNVTDSSPVLNCSIFNEGKYNYTNVSIKKNVDQSFQLSLSDSNHSWHIRCFDNSTSHNMRNSEDRLLRIDTIKPQVLSIIPVDSFDIANHTIKFTFNVTDANVIANCSLVVNKTVVNHSYGVARGAFSFMSTTLLHGRYYWQVNCTDQAGNSAGSPLRKLNATYPDLMLSDNDIIFAARRPVEGEAQEIIVTVHNIGDANASGVVVKFYQDSKAFYNASVFVKAKSSVDVSGSWIAKVGIHKISVELDPPSQTGGIIPEINETNNRGNITIYIPSFQIFYGSLLGELLLDINDNSSIVKWANLSNLLGNIYIADSDSSISWPHLTALGQDTNKMTRMVDFALVDKALNLTGLNDSINRTYTLNGAIRTTQSFMIYDANISAVPIIDSTNSSKFVTGLLWDSSDGLNHYNGSQDLVFVGSVGHNGGFYGKYDYEVRIPGNLRRYKSPNNYDTVTFYTEIT